MEETKNLRSACHNSSVTLKDGVYFCDVCGKECEVVEAEAEQKVETTPENTPENTAPVNPEGADTQADPNPESADEVKTPEGGEGEGEGQQV